MKTKRLWVLTLAALMVCGSASAKEFRRGKACKKCKQEQRFQRGKQCLGKEFVRFEDYRFQQPRFVEVRPGDPRFKGQKFRDQRFHGQKCEKARFHKKPGHKHHHRR